MLASQSEGAPKGKCWQVDEEDIGGIFSSQRSLKIGHRPDSFCVSRSTCLDPSSVSSPPLSSVRSQGGKFPALRRSSLLRCLRISQRPSRRAKSELPRTSSPPSVTIGVSHETNLSCVHINAQYSVDSCHQCAVVVACGGEGQTLLRISNRLCYPLEAGVGCTCQGKSAISPCGHGGVCGSFSLWRTVHLSVVFNLRLCCALCVHIVYCFVIICMVWCGIVWHGMAWHGRGGAHVCRSADLHHC